MQSLLQVVQEAQGGGSKTEPLPELLPVLTAQGIVFEPGQMAMICARPNGGKSMLALWYAVKARIGCLYFSADTDRRTTLYRAAAIKTSIEFDDIKNMLGTSAQDIVDEAIKEITQDGIQFEFAPNPSLDDLYKEVDAYIEVYGKPPEMVVVDNLLNVANDAGDFQGLVQIMGDLHSMARELDCALVVLHHVNTSTTKPEYPAPINSIRGQVSQYPEIILALAMLPEEGQMRVAMTKHRHRTPSPGGDTYETIYVDPRRMTFYNSKQELQSAATTREWT